jgi:predicted permease
MWMRVSGLFGSKATVDEELASHVQMHIDDNLRAGMSPEDAKRQALIKLGGVEQARQRYRDRAGLPHVESVVQDIRFALRQLRQNPGFTIVAVLVLGLGIAASTAIFNFVDRALIQPLPYAQPNRLVAATETIALLGRANLSYPDYLDWKRQNTVFSSMAAFDGSDYLLAAPSGTVMVHGARISDNFLDTLGVRPVLGRDFYKGEDIPGGPQDVIITYEAWQRRFSGRSNIVGSGATLSGVTYTVIGVLPRGFQFALNGPAEFWTPLQAGDECGKRRSCHNLNGIARLKDGVSVNQANAQMQAIAAQLERQYPDSNRGQGAIVLPLAEAISGDVRPILLTLLAGSALLLAIACINVASLLLVRSEGRRREFAVRGALGASSLRLTRQFVTESALLVLASVVLGLAGAYATTLSLTRLVPADWLAATPWMQAAGLNTHTLLFVLGISVISLVLFSLTPLLRLPTAHLREGLAEGSRTSAGIAWRRLGSHLVVVELAIAVILLAAAGLLGKSFYRLLRVDINFDPSHLAILEVDLSGHSYPTDPQLIAATHRIIESVSVLPGVQSASMTSVPPVTSNGHTDWLRIVGRPWDGKHIELPYRDVGAAYFFTLKVRLLRGRFFTLQDTAAKPTVIIINNAFARKFFPNQDPIGKQVGNPALTPKTIRTIVGVVDDLREGPLDSEIVPAEYEAADQSPDNDFELIVRTSQSEASVLPTIVSAIHQVDPGIGTANESSMAEHINTSQTAWLHRTSAWMVGGFAVLALVLSSVGLYGVIAYSVSQREREIGVRMALGAQRSSVYRLILSEAGKLALWGIAAGIACSLAATTLLRSLLFGVQTWDLAILAATALLLAMCAVLASYIPAYRAASVHPMVALRSE